MEKKFRGPCSFALHTHVANPPLPHSLSLPFAASSHIFFTKNKIGLTLLMFVNCMHRVPSRCCNIAYKHSTKCNSVSLNIRVWDAANSMTKCNAIQMRPNVARRFSDFATNSRAMTSMSMLYSLSLCTCRTARWLSRCWLIALRKYVFRRHSDEKLHSTKKLRGTNTLLVPQPKSWGLVSPGPVVVTPMDLTKLFL